MVHVNTGMKVCPCMNCFGYAVFRAETPPIVAPERGNAKEYASMDVCVQGIEQAASY